MTDNTQPEALRLAGLLELAPEDGVEPQTTEDAAAELRRQHTRIAELEARIKTMAEEHADELMVAHLDGRMRAEQPAPSAAVALSDDLRDRLVAISEAIADQDDRAAQAMLREILKAPQPSPTPQADSVLEDADRAMRAAQPAGAQQPGAAYAALPYKQALGSTNCMQCCVSYMMGLPLENVPDFATDGGWERFSDFAETQGYVAVMLPGNREYEADYLASGTTARGTSHMVVMNDGKLVHDPHPSNAGLVDVQCVWLLAKRASPTQWKQDEHTAFEASAKTYTSNVSFERDASDYVDMTASLLWHGWKLRASHGQAPAQAAPAYKDSTSELHVGDSAFENWYSTYNPAHKADKQRARDAYAAGMGDPLVTAAPDVSGYVSEWSGGLCTSDEAMDGIAKLYAAQPAGAQQPAPSAAAVQTIPGVQWQCGPQANGFTAPQADSQPAVYALAEAEYFIDNPSAWSNFDQRASDAIAAVCKAFRAARAPADSVTAPAAGAVAGPTSDLHPEKCPITGRPFFMTLDHPELGRVPTYGGPYDSYTIPAPEGEPTDPWHERELRSERYDHDAGWWVEGGEPIPLRIVHEDVLFELQEDAEAAAAPATQPAPQQETQEPVAWYVTGCGRLLDEDEAKAEARHIGGTARAMPLYTVPQPCPTCIALARTVMLDQVSFDRKPDCYGIRQITDDEGVEEWEDIRTSPDVAREEANDMMATGRGEIYEVVPLWTTPQPTQAQAGAVPLTDDQRCRIVLTAYTVGEAIDMVERHHGIKGGQHGTS